MKAPKGLRGGPSFRRSVVWVRLGKQRGRRHTRRSAKKSGRKNNVAKRASEPMSPGRSFKRRKRLVSRIWLDKVLAGEGEAEI